MTTFFKPVLAVLLCAVMLVTQIGCTSADTMKIVNLVIAELPTAISLANAIIPVVAGLTDAGTSVQVKAAGEDVIAGLQEAQILAKAYTEKQDASTFQALVAVVDKMVEETDAQLLAVAHIKNSDTAQKVTLALAGLSTTLHVIDGYLMSRLPADQVQAKAAKRTVKMKAIIGYLDQNYLEQKANDVGLKYGDVLAWQTKNGF